ncbi:MAG: triose-phosphate isomerase [Acidimicrobiia bacterium]
MPESSRRPIIAANWKMHHDHLVTIQHVQKLAYRLEKDDFESVDVAICPPFTDLRTLQNLIQADKLEFKLGAQNCYWEKEGAFTGEVSALFLAKLDVEYVIVGHSERRQLFGETNEIVNKKTKAVIANEMTPIVCVGETLEQREAGETAAVVSEQAREAFAGISAAVAATCVVAYEPIWAIGTGRTATPDDANDTCGVVRAALADLYDDATAEAIRIQYGGSVKPGNAKELMAMPEIDGALVGGASLDPDDFARIIQYPRA